jgi:hypothetical protein
MRRRNNGFDSLLSLAPNLILDVRTSTKIQFRRQFGFVLGSHLSLDGCLPFAEIGARQETLEPIGHKSRCLRVHGEQATRWPAAAAWRDCWSVLSLSVTKPLTATVVMAEKHRRDQQVAADSGRTQDRK